MSTSKPTTPIELPAWQALQAHRAAQQATGQSLRQYFASDPQRFEIFSRRHEGLLVDFSKQSITQETLSLLLELAEQAQISQGISRMFTGEILNNTEQRSVLHVALRDANADLLLSEQAKQAAKDSAAVLQQLYLFAEKVRSGSWRGYTDKPIRHIVNIGIGGSDLGPRLVCKALQPFGDPTLSLNFMSSVDGSHVHPILSDCDPETTLFIVASKTFTTQETMANAVTAREWLLAALGNEAAVAKHFVAVSTNQRGVQAFGIDPANMFEFWDWVGGRYSMWSAIGLAAIIFLGKERFRELLAGAHAMDQHFRDTPFIDNLPVLMALISVWNHNFLGADSHAMLVYDDYLRALPGYLQQLEMESNGKSVTRQGEPVAWTTGPIVWGGQGNNGQHAFYQLLHQGTRQVSADFIAPVEPTDPLGEHHAILLANCLAQSEALMKGKTEQEARVELSVQGLSDDQLERLLPYKTFVGNRPSTTILYQRLTPPTLGALLALYEHKVYVQGLLWDINSFDQWGVELGKQLAKAILPQLQGRQALAEHDSSTLGLLNFCRGDPHRGEQ